MKPRARRDDLVVQRVGGETLIYDTRNARAILLNPLAAQVWQGCDGQREVSDICKLLADDMEESAVWLALRQLEDHGLIEASGPDRLGRREALKHLATGAVVALPTIFAMTLPPPAAAASGCITLNNNCIFANSTQSNCCVNLRCDNLPPAICRPCFGTGTSFGSGGSIAACNALGTKNLCCNSSGTPILGVGNACLCP